MSSTRTSGRFPFSRVQRPATIKRYIRAKLCSQEQEILIARMFANHSAVTPAGKLPLSDFHDSP